jgi:hypothetical protein
MATLGTGTPSANGPKENQTGVGVTVGGSLPADGRDMGATAGASDTARAGGAQVARETAHQERSKTQRAVLLEQAEEAAAKLAELMGKLMEAGASPLPGETCREDRLRAATAILQMTEPPSQPAPELGTRVRTVAVGVLRTKESETGSQWRCKVLTCAETCHPLIACPQFLLMPAKERGDLVALFSLCKGCLTPGHGITVLACPFRDELDGLCAKPKCRQAHHQLLHVEGKPSPRQHHQPGQDTAVSKQHGAQVVATAVQLDHQPPVQLVTQRIRTAAGRSCVTFWDTGSQVTLMTHEAAKDMGLKPIPGPPLNLMGVGNSQKTRSTVRYKIPLVDTGGRTVEVAAYGMGHIMDPLETIDPMLMRAVFPEAPAGGIEAASGGVDLLMGHDNLRLFPVEQRRVEDAALHRSRFGTGWIASGRLPRPGNRAPAEGTTASAGVRTSAESATSAGEATNQEKAALTKDPAGTATRNKPGLEGKQKESSNP